jgi:chromate reductase
MNVVAITGSLRAASSNTALLRAAAAMAPEDMTVTVFEAIGGLPHFNPDLDEEGMDPPAPVAAFRALLGAADGFILSSPEYVHSLPGAFKNALDWVVSSGQFVGKPMLIVTTSPGGLGHASLVEILTVMSGNVLAEATVAVRAARNAFDEDGRLTDEKTAEALRNGLAALAAAIGEQA